MTDEFIPIKKELPEKGVDVIGKDKNGNVYHCFRCNCSVDPDCQEWRDSTTGYNLNVNIIKWKSK